jgi:hypothetical protein
LRRGGKSAKLPARIEPIPLYSEYLMPIGRTVRRTSLVLVAMLLAGALVVYLLASRVPADYRPRRQGREQRDAAMRSFRLEIQGFTNEGEENVPYAWSVDERSLNEYLDAADEIAVFGGGEAGEIHRVASRLGLRDPAIALDDGMLKLMVRSTRHEKIVSVLLRFDFTPEKKLRVRVAGARVGRLPVPSALVRGKIEQLGRTVERRLRAGRDAESPRIGGVSSRAVGRVLGQVLAAIGGEPIDTELSWKKTTKKRVRVERVEIDDGKLTLYVVPVGRPEVEPPGPPGTERALIPTSCE